MLQIYFTALIIYVERKRRLSMKRNEGFILQSLRARVADHRHDKSKTQHVIYEDRELAQEIPEATALLELGKGSSWRIVIPEILLGNVSKSFTFILLACYA